MAQNCSLYFWNSGLDYRFASVCGNYVTKGPTLQKLYVSVLSSSWCNKLTRLAFRKETNYWKWQILSRKEICTGNKQILKALFYFVSIQIIYFIFGCDGSSLLHKGFLQLQRAEAAFVVMCRLLIALTSSCRAQALGPQASVVAACGLRSCDARAVSPRHVESSQTKDQMSGLGSARWILNNWTTREASSL